MTANLTRNLAMSIFATSLAACSIDLTESEIAHINSEYRPLINTLVPACISAGLGQQPDYSGLTVLGYEHRAAIRHSGEYFYSTEGNALLGGKTGIDFVPGEGCTVNVPATDVKAFNEIGRIWHHVLGESGYSDSSGSASSYDFTANGVNFSFSGTKRVSSNAGAQVTYRLKRGH